MKQLLQIVPLGLEEANKRRKFHVRAYKQSRMARVSPEGAEVEVGVGVGWVPL